MSSDQKDREDSLRRRVDSLRADLKLRDKAALAHNTGAQYSDGRFQLPVWSRNVTIDERDFLAIDDQTGQACDGVTQAMLAYYFHTSDGMPPTNELVAFRELPDGQFYSSAFQGYTGQKLLSVFKDNLEEFGEVAAKLGGRKELLGDMAYRFQALPQVPVAIVCWLGDEDFPSSYRLLFDSAVSHHLPIDACAILGSMITGKLCATYAKEKIKDGTAG